MTKDEFVTIWNLAKDEIVKDIKDIFVWCDDRDKLNKNVCENIEYGLRTLIENGDKDAGVLYCEITAYTQIEPFSRELALKYLQNFDVYIKYKEIIRDDFLDILESEDFDNLYAFATLGFFEEFKNHQE